MYNGIKKIEEVIEIIENNITEEISCDLLASKMNLSVYEFRRIFSFIVGCPISEYIRRRRLSIAACEILASDNVNLRVISEKYGYDNQSAFIRAFGEQHGVSPGAYLKGEQKIKLFTRPKFEMTVFGRETVPMKIIKSEEFQITGFSGVSIISDSCCCENVWNEFYSGKTDTILENELAPKEIYVSYKNQGSNVFCNIGAKTDKEIENLTTVTIPAAKYACFAINTVDDDAVNEIYSQILYDWLPSTNLKRNYKLPTIEVYPFDMSREGFEWEIRIPLE